MRNMPCIAAGLVISALASFYVHSAVAQDDGTEAAGPSDEAPTKTLWNFLGIPQACHKIKDSLKNRTGDDPCSERTDPLKRIADPKNLAKKMPEAIKTAAKIKQDEDLAPQKIKAIKYLATVGCGCYEKYGVRKALLDSLDDCSEAVRYEAALALIKVAGSCGDKCGDTCCNAEVMNKLKQLADGSDDRCCPHEDSEIVRNAARVALNACKRKLPATNVTPITGPEKKGPERRGFEKIGDKSLEEEGEQPNGLAPIPDLSSPKPTKAKSILPPLPPPDKKPLGAPADAPSGDAAPLPGVGGRTSSVPRPMTVAVGQDALPRGNSQAGFAQFALPLAAPAPATRHDALPGANPQASVAKFVVPPAAPAPATRPIVSQIPAQSPGNPSAAQPIASHIPAQPPARKFEAQPVSAVQAQPVVLKLETQPEPSKPKARASANCQPAKPTGSETESTLTLRTSGGNESEAPVRLRLIIGGEGEAAQEKSDAGR